MAPGRRDRFRTHLDLLAFPMFCPVPVPLFLDFSIRIYSYAGRIGRQLTFSAARRIDSDDQERRVRAPSGSGAIFELK